MEDLSHIAVPGKITESGAFSMLPQSVMDGFSERANIDQAVKMLGLGNDTEEVTDGGSVAHD